MRKAILSLVLALVTNVAVQAQQIAVVSKSGTTSIYKTLPEAVAGASAGSTVYLPGGGFTLTDTLKINKKLTIIGVGYYIAGGNVDGVTTINGQISFINGSSGSALMGVHVPSPNYVWIGKDGSAVEDILIRYCWIHNIRVNNSQCTGCVINQNYCNYISLGETGASGSNAKVTNNVCYYISCGNGAEIKYNIILASSYPFGGSDNKWYSRNCVISNNFILYCNIPYDCQFFDNIGKVGIEGIEMIDASWNDVFVKYGSSPNPQYDYHFTEAYQQYEGKVGIYAGSGFSDSGLPPVPYIVSKQIPYQTDRQGKLNIKVRVRASE